MQTFLPYPSFNHSAYCLDNKRLGKQRVEVLQILRTLTQQSDGWKNHPAVRMWKGYEEALVEYGVAICLEWIGRGFQDSCLTQIEALGPKTDIVFPPWLGDPEFHRSHQSNLLRKDFAYYSKFGWDVPDDLPYKWPVP